MNTLKILWLLLLFAPLAVFAQETTVESDEAHYDGLYITLTGDVIVENAMGRITAEKAILRKDEEGRTKIDFPWIELKQNVKLTLAEGGTLYCDNVFLDYSKMTSLLRGNPQVSYLDVMGEIYADRAIIDYVEKEGSIEPRKITLFDHVRLVNLGTDEKPASQYALADQVAYFPEEQLMILEGKNNRVLFYDTLRDMQLSAKTVRAQRDLETKKDSIRGIGDVRFVFGQEELEKIKQQFKVQ